MSGGDNGWSGGDSGWSGCESCFSGFDSGSSEESNLMDELNYYVIRVRSGNRLTDGWTDGDFCKTDHVFFPLMSIIFSDSPVVPSDVLQPNLNNIAEIVGFLYLGSGFILLNSS